MAPPPCSPILASRQALRDMLVVPLSREDLSRDAFRERPQKEVSLWLRIRRCNCFSVIDVANRIETVNVKEEILVRRRRYD